MPQGSGKPNGPHLVTTDDEAVEKKQVVDFAEARAQKLEEKRRKTERVFFRQLLSVYSVIGNAAMFPIEMIDISEDGLSFQTPFNPEKPWPTDMNDVPIRFYFTQDSYLEIRVNIQNARPSIEDGSKFTRYGCSIDRGMTAYPAYQQFVRFLKMYAEHSHKDSGDISVFYL